MTSIRYAIRLHEATVDRVEHIRMLSMALDSQRATYDLIVRTGLDAIETSLHAQCLSNGTDWTQLVADCVQTRKQSIKTSSSVKSSILDNGE